MTTGGGEAGHQGHQETERLETAEVARGGSSLWDHQVADHDNDEIQSAHVSSHTGSTGHLRRSLRFLNGNDLARDLIIGLILVLAGFGTAYWLENRIANQQQEIENQRAIQQQEIENQRATQQQEIENQRAQHQEVLENTRFVREVALNPDVRDQPFIGLDLREADLNLLDLSCRGGPDGCAKLALADLSGASLSGANLSGAYLMRTNLRGANLRFADLRGADLTNADLTHADLFLADLRGAVLRTADLSKTRFLGKTCYNEATTWPAGFQPPHSPTCHRVFFRGPFPYTLEYLY